MLLSPNTAITIEGNKKGASVSGGGCTCIGVAGTSSAVISVFDNIFNPVTTADVYLCGEDNSNCYKLTNNLDGTYSSNALAAGTYTIRAGAVDIGFGSLAGQTIGFIILLRDVTFDSDYQDPCCP